MIMMISDNKYNKKSEFYRLTPAQNGEEEIVRKPIFLLTALKVA